MTNLSPTNCGVCQKRQPCFQGMERLLSPKTLPQKTQRMAVFESHKLWVLSNETTLFPGWACSAYATVAMVYKQIHGHIWLSYLSSNTGACPPAMPLPSALFSDFSIQCCLWSWKLTFNVTSDAWQGASQARSRLKALASCVPKQLIATGRGGRRERLRQVLVSSSNEHDDQVSCKPPD